MAEIRTLTATARAGTGKGAARSVRREGRIPGVIYGGGDAAEPITLDYRELNKLIYAGHFLTTIYEIDVGGAKQRVIPRDYQLDPVKDQPLHVDFLRLKPGGTLRVQVPVHFINHETCPGIKKGGALNIVLHAVEMRAPADAIPEAIVADLATLDINDSLHISAIALPDGCKPTVRDRDFTIATITPPLVVAEDPAAAAAAAAAGAKGGKAAPKAAAAAPAEKAAPKKK
ncbi:50S ribosomal protein L25/general stress protein Ctc [Methylocapsa palsarum]|uniref:Large ribosomal subunit protein bL25 n=1 Tax=Methylocapsa palsarum TaxID=1612308 RepID=A0A1I4CCI4_9HYPH|nr:50S ribosomal protein L25/general stress protein Ctc [Methylocapsa palsarum]SFK78483.1 large subunit ribosomal protein L25 [Methylocapsa palsarum]